MSKLHVLNHPLIQHKVSMMRMTDTVTKDFRQLADEISLLMAYEVTRDLPLEAKEIETPICKMQANFIAGRSIGVVPILRAGLGMVNGILTLVPNAKVGHIGLYRDPETHMPVEYYCKLPVDADKRTIIVVDPMLATGLSMEVGYKALLSHGTPKSVHVACLFGTPQAIDYLSKTMPEHVTLWCAVIDPVLNEKKYIVPGLGDAGDLCFGEKL